MFTAIQRGKFLETITMENDYWGFEPDTLQLLGMFSLLDAMLQIPMTDIVVQLPLEDKLKSALLSEPNNEYLPLLQLARVMEEVKWEKVERLAITLNLEIVKISAAFKTSIEWAIKWLEIQSNMVEQ
jgi:EAL and modified HD-GYP domain-containing signal transduction protein